MRWPTGLFFVDSSSPPAAPDEAPRSTNALLLFVRRVARYETTQSKRYWVPSGAVAMKPSP